MPLLSSPVAREAGAAPLFFLRTPSFQLHTESLSLHTPQSLVSSDKPSSQLHNLFSHPSSSLQRRHRREKSAKVHASRSLFLLCLLPAEFLMFPLCLPRKARDGGWRAWYFPEISLQVWQRWEHFSRSHPSLRRESSVIITTPSSPPPALVVRETPPRACIPQRASLKDAQRFLWGTRRVCGREGAARPGTPPPPRLRTTTPSVPQPQPARLLWARRCPARLGSALPVAAAG